MSIEGESKDAGREEAISASQQLDCETAMLLRATIRPIFANAGSWTALAEVLKDKGYRLAFRRGRLCITEHETGKRVCGLKFLGIEFLDLVRRMGRPIVVARGKHADGDVLTARPHISRA
ncbi:MULTISPECIES: hypothetical protein [unclassified Ruegeria]|uniref:hypothetical protein n=1 Tax=unclassified Ruegeria TaxID=2625375 RepID=UPI0014878667|nr:MULTISPECIES: hypothetical protein [unclassified Ruegeria]